MQTARLGVALALVTLITFSGGDAHAQAPQAERPTYTLGEKWIRSDGIYELVRIEADRYVFAGRPGQQVHLSKNLGLIRLESARGVFEFDPPPAPTWPLRVGRIASAIGTWKTPSLPAGVPKKFTLSVDAYQDVQVAGTAMKVFAMTLQITDPVPGPRSRTWEREVRLWYSPELRQYVKAEAEVLGSMLNWAVVAVDQPQALAVIINQPAREARVETSEVGLVGSVVSGRGVEGIVVSVNGVEATRRDFKQRPKELPFRIPVRLVPGRNVVLVTATGVGGQTVQEARTLFAPEVVARPPPRSEPPATRPGPVPTRPEPSPPRAEPEARRPPPPAAAPPVTAAVSAPALEVRISSPADQVRVQHDSVVVAGLVAASKGVSRVVISVNGIEASRVEERAPRSAVALNVPVKLRDGANTVVVTATDVDGRPSQEVRTIHYEPVVPLTVAVRYPEDRAKLGDPSTVVVAAIALSKGVARVSVTLNGAEVAVPGGEGGPERSRPGGERALPRSLSLTVPMTLRVGTNVIVISAAEADGTLRQELRTVVHEPAVVAAVTPTPAAPAARPQPEPGRWAVVIGVGAYDSPDIPALRYSVRDAEAIHQALLGAGFKKEHVVLLTDRTERKPTLKNIKWALGTFLARSARKDDTVVIFFAGHGAPEIDPRGLERDGLAKYLIPSDAEPEDLYSSALPMDELQTIFGRVESERVVAFLDACYSGGAGGRSFASKKTRAGHVDDLFLERLTRSKGRAIITASRPSEVSVELPELGHGIFTYYVVQGLKGAGDLNRDGIVSLQELYEYVEQQVTRKSRAVGGNQHPVMKGELEGVLPLVKIGGR